MDLSILAPLWSDNFAIRPHVGDRLAAPRIPPDHLSVGVDLLDEASAPLDELLVRPDLRDGPTAEGILADHFAVSVDPIEDRRLLAPSAELALHVRLAKRFGIGLGSGEHGSIDSPPPLKDVKGLLGLHDIKYRHSGLPS